MKLQIRLLVTDKDVTVLRDSSDIREQVVEAFVYEGAKIAEIRDVTIEVELPVPSPTTNTTPIETIEVPIDVREAVRKAAEEKQIKTDEDRWREWMRVCPPGLYWFHRTDYSYGMTRIPAADLPDDLLMRLRK